MDPTLRQLVDEHFTLRRHAAWVPCYAIDLVALLRHVGWARRRDAVRDGLLVAIGVVGLVVAVLAIAGGNGVAVAMPLVVAGTVGMVRLRVIRGRTSVGAIVRRVLGTNGGRRWPAARRIAELAAAAAIGVGLLCGTDVHWLAGLPLAGALLVVSSLVVVGSSALAYLAACRTAGAPGDPVDIARAMGPAEEERASGMSRSNVLVYTRDRAKSPLGPFVGSGHQISRWFTPPVDVTKGRRGENGEPSTPRDVDLRDLHEHLERSARDLGLAKLTVQHRLYVDGAAMSARSELLRSGRHEQPIAAISDWPVIDEVTRANEYNRAYVCLTVMDWRGDLVVTMFVRGIRTGRSLVLEVAVHVLPEVGWDAERVALQDLRDEQREQGRAARRPTPPPVRRKPLAVPGRSAYAALTGARQGGRDYWSTLVGAAPRLIRAAARPVHRTSASTRYRSLRRSGGSIDYGADASLREHLARGQQFHYNAVIDMFSHYGQLQRWVLAAFTEYLTACGIDDSELVRRLEVFVNNNFQNTFNDYRAGAMSFGAGGTAQGTYNEESADDGGSGGSAQQS